MRVILKPGGVMLVVLAMTLLSALIFVRAKSNPSGANGANAPTGIADVSGTTPVMSTPNDLLISGLETFATVAPLPPASKASVTGEIASSFFDNSDWAQLTIAYSRETQNPHAGTACQKIAIGDMKSGQVQFNSEFTVPKGTKLKVTIWLRADAPLPTDTVQLCLRDKGTPNMVYKQTDLTVGESWQSFEITGTTTSINPTYFMVIARKPNISIYVDDVTIVRNP